MKRLFFNVVAVFLMLAGGSLLVIGFTEGQPWSMMLGAALALLAGLVALLMQYGYFSQRMGTILGIAFACTALLLAYRNYRVRHDVAPVEPTTSQPDTTAHGQ